MEYSCIDVIYMIRLIGYSITITPYRIAFEDVTPLGWVIADSLIDFMFLVDIMVTFFVSYFDDEEKLIMNKKVLL